MSKKQIVALVVIAAIAAFFIGRMIRNALTSEEAKIKKLIKQLAADFEDKKLDNVFEYITDDYTDDGNHTKEQLQKDARTLLPLIAKIDVSIRDLRVVVAEDEQTAEAGFAVKVLITTRVGDVEPFEEGNDQVRINFRREDGRWMICGSSLRTYRTDF